jgi:PAS domain S-box-containing protein
MSDPQNDFPLDQLKHLFGAEENNYGFQQKITDFFPAIIYVYDADNKKLLYINKKITDFLGYDYADIKSWDDDFMKMIFNEDVELVKREMQTYYQLKEEETHSYNCRLNHKSGNWKHFKTMGTLLKRKEDGQPLSMLFVAEDISDEAKCEEEIKAMEELVNETEELLQFGTWSWDIKTQQIQCSEGFYKLLGYKKEEIQGKISRDFYLAMVSEEDREPFLQNIRKAIIDKNGFEYTYTITTANGKKIFFTKGKTIVDETTEMYKIIGITHDITEQTLSYRNLLHYKEMMIEKEKFSGYGTWEFNYAEKKMEWSDGMYFLFGYDISEKNEITIDETLYSSYMTKASIEKGTEIIKTILSSQDSSYTWEYEIITKDGTPKTVETYARIIRDENKQPAKIIGTTKDITQLKEYKKQNEIKLKELDRSNKDLEEFAYVASHDLQEPLRKITTFSERLQTKFANELSDDARVYLTKIDSSVTNMRVLIDNLLEFSRITRRGKIFEPTDLNLILNEVKTELELSIEETKAVIISEKLPVIEAIPSQMRRLFNNLFSNALKFSKKELSPLININCTELSRNEKIKYQFEEDKKYYKITVKDNGIGFEEEYAEKVFQIFQRLHGKSEYPGSGIGLAICKKIVENHNGVIFATSIPAEGSVFTIIFPEKLNS